MKDLATAYMARRYAKGGKVSGCYSDGGEVKPLMSEELNELQSEEGMDFSGDLDEPMDEMKEPIEAKKPSLLSKILGSMLKSRSV